MTTTYQINGINPTSSTITVSSTGSGYTPITSVGYAGASLASSGVTASWTNSNTYFNNSSGTSIMTIPYGEDKIVIAEKAALEVNGKMVLNGVDMEERLKTIEKVLQIPTRDVTMETKHPKLAELYQQYMHELEKYKTWERIKGDD